MRRALLVSVLGLMALSGCASSGSPHADGAVPWVNRPLPLYRPPAAKLIRYPTTAPACRAAQLRVVQGRFGGAAGNDVEPMLFTNIGSRTCLLRGYPTVTAETAAGGRVTLHPRRGTFFGPMTPADLLPGRHIFLYFATATGCEGGSKPGLHYHNLAFTLPQGGVLSGGRVSILRQCGLDMSAFGRPQQYVDPKARPGTAGTLTATASLTAIKPGTKELDYVVTLFNPTARTVRLVPCPGYTQNLYSPGVAVLHRSFRLNCDSVRAIRPHGHVRYAMRLTLPAPPRSGGVVKFVWALDTPNGPFVGRGFFVGAK